MCGINLILDKRGQLSEDTIFRMTGATAHRGPDVTAFHTEKVGIAKIFFGHNRLKIIDTSDCANQPFISSDGRYILIYNGEIYNYQELRQILIKSGHTFHSQSDTEVVLQLLILKGTQGLALLNGMFALAFYDVQQQRLIMARDRFGIKPFFYTETADYFILSSEIKSIAETGLIPKELNASQIAHYLKYKHAAKPQTFYKNILELEEGYVLIWEKGQTSLQTYLPSSTTQATFSKLEVSQADQVTEQVESILIESIQEHLIADVPIGLFLSGGIDSTLLLALLHSVGHRHFPSFSIVHKTEDGAFGTDDSRYAQLAARQYNSELTCFEIDDSLLLGTDALVETLSQPIADGAALLTSYLSQQVKSEIKVALSGAGADELFAGYNRHKAYYNYLKYKKTLLPFRHILKQAKPLFITGINHPLRKQFLLLQKLLDKIEPDPQQTFLNFTAMDNKLQDLLPTNFKYPSQDLIYSNNSDWLHWCLQYEQHNYLITDILALTDQTSMRYSLEVRTPYLENKLQHFLQSVNSEHLLKNGSKWILKNILAKHNGQAYLNRRKEGFGMPLGNWLKKSKNQWLLNELQDLNSIVFGHIDFIKTQQLIKAHLSNRYDYSTEIWALIVLAKWLQHNFG